ncbi:ArsR/SmtB family transcription factor [Alkaliphilus hydrothermalis]|uniref:ArsR family transcriptional regulator n=1 Tax=Alkaliphilus hydrothermalis TaxID=1482730 RepID=A0ABS2NQ74_9FIRM|nr:metalloregulator ArsR/SmtB family transcription factor [Alkaliphilus hydrothermalis]MBM7615088.1 ArsR family transcriptional regulator [Alkaliphilus hydrothermalis]
MRNINVNGGDGIKELVDIFKALSDENRIKIVQMLVGGELCACDIQEHFQLTQPTISHHMKVLMQSGLVEGEKRGKWMFYCINDLRINELKAFIDGVTKKGFEDDQTMIDRISYCQCDGERKK